MLPKITQDIIGKNKQGVINLRGLKGGKGKIH